MMSSDEQLIDNDFLNLISLSREQDTEKLNDARHILKVMIIQIHQTRELHNE
jgi:hypothetical protein